MASTPAVGPRPTTRTKTSAHTSSGTLRSTTSPQRTAWRSQNGPRAMRPLSADTDSTRTASSASGTASTRASLRSLFYPTDIPAAHAALAKFDLADKLFDRVDRLSGGERQRVGLARALVAPAAWASPKFFYDALGSRLFDVITELPEYYPTRTEAAIFAQHGAAIATAALTAGPGINPFGDEALALLAPWWDAGPCVGAAEE